MAVDASDAASTDEMTANEATGPAIKATADLSLDHAFKSMLGPIETTIGGIAERLERLESIKPDTDAAASPDALKELKKRQGSIFNAINELAGQIKRLAEKIDLLQEPEPQDDAAAVVDEVAESDEEQAADNSDQRWGRIILGPQLSENESVAEARDKLLEDALEGNEDAVGLAARLMLVQSAPRDTLPALMKELGEAFYRWRPKTTSGADRVEQALVAWLHDRLSAEELRNRIDVVHVGDQYDSARHLSSPGGGIEVSRVNGWVVLRDNGRPLSKARVSLKQD